MYMDCRGSWEERTLTEFIRPTQKYLLIESMHGKEIIAYDIGDNTLLCDFPQKEE